MALEVLEDVANALVGEMAGRLAGWLALSPFLAAFTVPTLFLER